MKKLLVFVILVGAINLFAASAFAISLGTAGDYNAFVFGDFKGVNSDIGGALAAGGNVSLQSYGVGTALSSSNSGNVLVTGGNLTYTNGQIYKGNAVVGGTATMQSVGIPDGVVTDNASVPIDFATERTYLTNLSQTLANMTTTGTVMTQWGGIYLTGDGVSALQVFSIDGQTLSSTNTFKFYNNIANIAENATVVFNVSGTVDSMSNFDMSEFKNALGDSWDNVIFNFYEAMSLQLTSIGIVGNILAPLADITADYGSIDGTVIADSWSGSMELHNKPFDGDTPSAVPEPGTFALVGLGLLGLVGIVRRRNS